jgi:hypothetical protein
MDAEPFAGSVGDVGVDVATDGAQKSAKNGGAGDAVDVVVAVDVDLGFRVSGVQDCVSGEAKIGQKLGIVKIR